MSYVFVTLAKYLIENKYNISNLISCDYDQTTKFLFVTIIQNKHKYKGKVDLANFISITLRTPDIIIGFLLTITSYINCRVYSRQQYVVHRFKPTNVCRFTIILEEIRMQTNLYFLHRKVVGVI